jgi:LmbE family N-acetylglucosaminyl deacetylase
MEPERFIDWLAGRAVRPPRVAVIVAHPDDEVIGAGSQLRRLRDAWFVHVTDGAPRDGRDAAANGLDVAGYARVRRREARRALALVGVGAERIVDLAVPDQQTALHLVPIALRLGSFLREHAVEVVLTHPYEGGHPDHDAIAFAVSVAARVAGTGVVEHTSYHGGPQGLVAGQFLGGRADLALEADRDLRRRLFACHRTQAAALVPFLDLDVERFRVAPRYDFARPPHDGPLHYEAFDWGITGARFRALATAAEAELACR